MLASGSGTNLQAMLGAEAKGILGANIRLVVSDKPHAPALDRARLAKAAAVFVDPAGKDREQHDRAVMKVLAAHDVGLVCLAGYMRVLSPVFVHAYPGRLVNVHPALLPAFPGLRAQQQALDAGVRVAGCTTHFVEDAVDRGPSILQATVPVLDGDTADRLAARIQTQEHRIFPLTIRLFAEGRLRLEGRRVKIDPPVGKDELTRFGLDPRSVVPA